MDLTKIIPLCAFLASPLAADEAGLRQFTIDMPHHGEATQATLWYPAAGGGREITFAENPVFQGVPAQEGAQVAAGAHPLIVLSHGMGGSTYSVAWLGAALAERGAVVIAVNHLNSSWVKFDMVKGTDHWTRVWDMSRALDAVLDDPSLTIDTSRIMAAGFSYGGWSALSMGGVRANHGGFVAACEAQGADLSYCPAFLSDEIDLPGRDANVWNADYGDDRVTHVSAIDPGFVWGLEAGDIALPASTTVLSLGDASDQMRATDIHASGFADLGRRQRSRASPLRCTLAPCRYAPLREPRSWKQSRTIPCARTQRGQIAGPFTIRSWGSSQPSLAWRALNKRR